MSLRAHEVPPVTHRAGGRPFCLRPSLLLRPANRLQNGALGEYVREMAAVLLRSVHVTHGVLTLIHQGGCCLGNGLVRRLASQSFLGGFGSEGSVRQAGHRDRHIVDGAILGQPDDGRHPHNGVA